jgi:hypothetical protein
VAIRACHGEVDAVDVIAIEQFCALAASLGKSSQVFDAMRDAAKRPSTPLEMRVSGTAYSCPWVVGPTDSADRSASTRNTASDFHLHARQRDLPAVLRELGGAAEGRLLDRVDRAHREFRARAARCHRTPRANRQGVPSGDRGIGGLHHVIEELAADTIWE